MSCNCGGVRSDIAAIGKLLASMGGVSSKPEREAAKKLKKQAKKKNETNEKP